MIYGESRKARWDEQIQRYVWPLGRRSRRHQLRMQDSWRQDDSVFASSSGLKVQFRTALAAALASAAPQTDRETTR